MCVLAGWIGLAGFGAKREHLKERDKRYARSGFTCAHRRPDGLSIVQVSVRGVSGGRGGRGTDEYVWEGWALLSSFWVRLLRSNARGRVRPAVPAWSWCRKGGSVGVVRLCGEACCIACWGAGEGGTRPEEGLRGALLFCAGFF